MNYICLQRKAREANEALDFRISKNAARRELKHQLTSKIPPSANCLGCIQKVKKNPKITELLEKSTHVISDQEKFGLQHKPLPFGASNIHDYYKYGENFEWELNEYEKRNGLSLTEDEMHKIPRDFELESLAAMELDSFEVSAKFKKKKRCH